MRRATTNASLHQRRPRGAAAAEKDGTLRRRPCSSLVLPLASHLTHRHHDLSRADVRIAGVGDERVARQICSTREVSSVPKELCQLTPGTSV